MIVRFGRVQHTQQVGLLQWFETTSGCDSVLVLDLTINNSYEAAIETVVACDSAIWQGAVYTASGLYCDGLQTTSGCDSVLVLDLTINNSYEAAIDTMWPVMVRFGRVQHTQQVVVLRSLQTTSV